MMGQSELRQDDEGRTDEGRARLLDAARALMLRGEEKFSIAAVCAEAGVDRTEFRNHFPGRGALMAALTQQAPEPKQDLATAIESAPVTQPEIPTPAAPAPSEPAQADAWLERRLRVFERALNALEARAETREREQARTIALLEEKLSSMGGAPMPRREAAPVKEAAAPVITSTTVPVQQAPVTPEVEKTLAPELVLPEAPPAPAVSREEMAEVLQNARDKARAAAAIVPEEKKKPDNRRLRWLAIGGLSLVALFLCIGLTLGNTASATQNEAMGTGTTYRKVAADDLHRTIALADAGDARAQAKLAMAYVRGEGVDNDAIAAARWSASAARAGQPVAQYLMGALYAHGDGVTADPARAFRYFTLSAAQGNLKAMHNLAIAYAQGTGTAKDEAKAAEWFTLAAERGYVDSAFDLAVLYERGLGVKQDLGVAFKWYAVAGLAGDEPSKARAAFLHGQMKPADAQRAAEAAQEFAPLPSLAAANELPKL
jgi:TPR repeat protein